MNEDKSQIQKGVTGHTERVLSLSVGDDGDMRTTVWAQPHFALFLGKEN